MRAWVILLWVWLVAFPLDPLAQTIDASVLPAPDPWRFVPLQRVQALLSRSTRENPIPVRILFYGQSITRQDWWLMTVDELHRSFPEANLVIENRAISSFNASFLIKTAEADVFPFQPDLIIYHSYGPYGPGGEWDRLLRSFRQRTTADVILLGNHVLSNSEISEPVPPDPIPYPSEAWLNEVFSPNLARELGFCFPDNRSAWKAYLRSAALPVSALLGDAVHLNLKGSELQFKILQPYLKTPRFIREIDPFDTDRVRSVSVGARGIPWRNSVLRWAFVGNRIDAVSGLGPRRRCRVLVDGKRPSDWPSGRGHGRASQWSWDTRYWPALLKIGAQARLLPEQWTLTVDSMEPGRVGVFEFSIKGTQTGPDGHGSSTNVFLSQSGRVHIDPSDWLNRFLVGEPKPGSQVIWTTEDRSLDEYLPGNERTGQPDSTVTLVNDLPDGPHILELIADGPELIPPVAELRAYHPAGSPPGAEVDSEGRPQLQILPWTDGFLTVWSENGGANNLSFRPELGSPGTQFTPNPVPAYGFYGVRVPQTERSGFFQLEPVPR